MEISWSWKTEITWYRFDQQNYKIVWISNRITFSKNTCKVSLGQTDKYAPMLSNIGFTGGSSGFDSAKNMFKRIGKKFLAKRPNSSFWSSVWHVSISEINDEHKTFRISGRWLIRAPSVFATTLKDSIKSVGFLQKLGSKFHIWNSKLEHIFSSKVLFCCLIVSARVLSVAVSGTSCEMKNMSSELSILSRSMGSNHPLGMLTVSPLSIERG